MRKWSQNDKPSGFVITWIFFALLSVLSVKSYASEHDFDTEPNSVKSALESLLKSIESLETAPAIEPNAREEIQSQTKKYIELRERR
jgi:hypothetical protein